MVPDSLSVSEGKAGCDHDEPRYPISAADSIPGKGDCRCPAGKRGGKQKEPLISTEQIYSAADPQSL